MTVLDEGDYQHPQSVPTTVTRSGGMTVFLDGVEHPVDITQYRRSSIAATKEGITSPVQPSEGVFSHEGSWWRHQIDFRHGQGQDRFDFDEDANERRYRTGHGVNPWDDGGLGLQHGLVEDHVIVATLDPVSGAFPIFLVATGTHLYLAYQASFFRCSTLGGAWTTLTNPGAGIVKGLATDGTSVYYATTGGVYRFDSTATTSLATLGGGVAGYPLFFAANRLFLARDNGILYEVGAASITTVIDHQSGEFLWTAVFALGSKIYAGGYSGSRTEMYSLVTLDDGSLARGPEAASFLNNELIRCGEAYAGIAVLGTSLGVRIAVSGGDGTLTYGPLIETDGAVTQVAADGEFVWFNGLLSGSADRLGRLSLSTFTDQLVPAYAEDLASTGSSGLPALVRYGGKTVFADVSTLNVQFEDTASYVDGSFSSGRIYFGTIEQKRGVTLIVAHDPLTAGSITATVANDGGVEVGTFENDVVGSTGFTVDLSPTTLGRWFEISFTLDSIAAVRVSSWQLRAIAVPRAVQRWIVPLIVAEVVLLGDGEGQEESRDVDATIDEIVDAWRTKRVVEYVEGGRVHFVRVEAFQHEAKSWADGKLNGVLTVELIETG